MDLLELYDEIVHEPAVKVYCDKCRLHIYNIDELPVGGTYLRASLFKPARPDLKTPRPGERAVCPYCGDNFLTPEGELLIKLLQSDQK